MIIPKPVKKGDPIRADHFNTLVAAIIERTPLSFFGGRLNKTPSGFSITISQGSQSLRQQEQPPPWQVLSFTPANLLTLYPGLTNGLIPTNVLTGITIDPEADLWISVRHTTDGKRIISAEIIALDSPPASPSCELGGAPATFDWPVVLRAQGRFFQLEYANLSFQPFEAWRETVANPEPAAPQWQSWWTWKRY